MRLKMQSLLKDSAITRSTAMFEVSSSTVLQRLKYALQRCPATFEVSSSIVLLSTEDVPGHDMTLPLMPCFGFMLPPDPKSATSATCIEPYPQQQPVQPAKNARR